MISAVPDRSGQILFTKSVSRLQNHVTGRATFLATQVTEHSDLRTHGVGSRLAAPAEFHRTKICCRWVFSFVYLEYIFRSLLHNGLQTYFKPESIVSVKLTT